MKVFDEKTGKMIDIKASSEMEKWAREARKQQKKLTEDLENKEKEE